jgi:hypothetical protein
VPQSTVLQKPFACAELVTALANLLVAQQSLPPRPSGPFLGSIPCREFQSAAARPTN